MFDIGFSEIVVIGVVALVVVGPERLPRVARTLGHLFGRMQRYVAEVKADISREIELDELRRLQSSMQEAAKDVERSVSNELQYVENEVRQAEQETRKTVESAVSGIDLTAGLVAGPQPDNAVRDQPAEEAPQLELGLDQPTKEEQARQ
jgi:sec-independent protein translocase protein TatB